MKTALITGASAGIGEACAYAFAKSGYRLILLARRLEKLEAITSKIKAENKIDIINLVCDVRSLEAVKSALGSLPEEWKQIDVLINNAGLARGLSKIHEGSIDDWEEMIDTNIKGLLYVSRIVLPWMVARRCGTVINIASLAGREVYPNGNVYCATKHAVKALSQGMLMDLNGTGVRVTNLDPGMVETEFSEVRFHGDSERAKTVYKGLKPLTGSDIADVALYCAELPAHVMVQDIMVTPTAQASAMIVTRNS
jgi:NADP-dependent 3-hydroxy acid dehydrogenase YdfG